MVDGEQVIAEKDVPLRDEHVIHVQISRHAAEEFWRVAFSAPNAARRPVDITLGTGQSFLLSLIEEATGGQQSAWNHLAQWAHTALLKPATLCRTAIA